MVSWIFRQYVVAIINGHVLVHNIASGEMEAPRRACIVEDFRDGEVEYIPMPCIDIEENAIWHRVLDCDESSCQLL